MSKEGSDLCQSIESLLKESDENKEWLTGLMSSISSLQADVEVLQKNDISILISLAQKLSTASFNDNENLLNEAVGAIVNHLPKAVSAWDDITQFLYQVSCISIFPESHEEAEEEDGEDTVGIDSETSKMLSAMYWAEEDEMKAGIHPSQVKERIENELNNLGIQYRAISYLDWDIPGPRVKVSVDDRFFGIFNYEENKFDSISGKQLIKNSKDFKLNNK